MLVSTVVHAVRQHLKSRDERESDETANNCEMEQAGLGHQITSLRGLETDVLQSLGGVPIQPRREGVVAAAHREVALGDPDPAEVLAGAGYGLLLMDRQPSTDTLAAVRGSGAEAEEVTGDLTDEGVVERGAKAARSWWRKCSVESS